MSHPLTPRQRDVLAALLEGLSVKEIAKRVGMAPTTAKVRIGEILVRTGYHSREQLLGAYLVRANAQLQAVAELASRDPHAPIGLIVGEVLVGIRDLAADPLMSPATTFTHQRAA